MAQSRLGVLNKSDRAILHADQGTWFWFFGFIFAAGPQVRGRGPSGGIYLGMLIGRGARLFVRRFVGRLVVVGVVRGG